MASAIAWRLYQSNIRHICMLELEQPLCVRRTVSFCTALERGTAMVEGVEACSASSASEIEAAWSAQKLAVVRTTDWTRIAGPAPDVVIDAILAKRNLGTRRSEAPLVIALGPGFEAGRDCHLVIETNRGHDLGRIIHSGSAQPNTGIPGDIAGYAQQRVLRAPATGLFQSDRHIGEKIQENEVIGHVSDHIVKATTSGVLRGLIRPGTRVAAGMKIGDIDPRGRPEYCHTISDKARAIAGAVLEGVMRYYNVPPGLNPC